MNCQILVFCLIYSLASIGAQDITISTYPVNGNGTTTLSGTVQFYPKPVCGTDSVNPTANITLLQISCVDYEALRKAAPQIPWPPGTRTQVLIHVRVGDVARITLNGEVKYSDIIKDSSGRLIAMVQFDGTEHTSVNVKVLSEVK